MPIPNLWQVEGWVLFAAYRCASHDTDRSGSASCITKTIAARCDIGEAENPAAFAILDAGLMPVRNPASATFAAKELLKVVGQQAASLSIDFASPRPHAPASAG